MENRFELKSASGANNISIIGVKGLPPEFEGTSGVEFYVTQKIPTLIRKGFLVHCYVRKWATSKNITQYLGANLIQTPSVPIGFLDAVTHSFVSTVHACFSSVDIVWYHATGSLLFSFLPRLFGKKVFVTIHTQEWRRTKWGGLARLVLRVSEQIGIQSATTRFAVSESLRQYIQLTYGKNAYVDKPEALVHDRVPPAILKKKYSLNGNDYILYLGRFVPEKRIEWLIRAYTKLHPSNMYLVVAGGETYGRGYEAKLREMAAGNKNILFTGWVFGDEKQALLDNCALFVLPSLVEGNPMVLQELQTNTHILVSSHIAKELGPRANIHTYDQASEASLFRQLKRAIIRR